MMRSKRFIISTGIFLLLNSSACTLITDWDPNNLYCDLSDTSENQCLPGYSCKFDKCVEHQSLPEGETCSENIQCEDGLYCANFICSKECFSYYDIGGVCTSSGTEQICLPLRNEDATVHAFFERGYCIESQCSNDEDCQENDPYTICVKFSNNMGQCFTECTPEFNSQTGIYIDSYPNGTCHPLPVGTFGQNARMVQYPAGSSIEGDACDIVLNPCQEGLVCYRSVSGGPQICRKLCNRDPQAQASGCVEDEQTCVQQNENFSICIDN